MGRDKGPFRMKQFSMRQDHCAMKIGTDGVILGASVQTESPRTVLDIGTGSGLIALMLAQKYSSSTIHAIDISEEAIIDAAYNFSQSKWDNYLSAYQTSLQDFVSDEAYDVIVSNPPFFTAGSRAPESKRAMARHTDQLPFEELLKGVDKRLSPSGEFYVIIPFLEQENFIQLANNFQLHCSQLITVYPDYSKRPIRSILRFSRDAGLIDTKTLSIRFTGSGNFSDEYKLLCKEYYPWI